APGLVTASVQALATFDDGSGLALYAGGGFASAGSVPARNVARWDGSAWTTVGGWTSGGSAVTSLVAFDDGGGLALYAGGNFSAAGGVTASNIARWDGANWSAVGSGTGSVMALCPYDVGGAA